MSEELHISRLSYIMDFGEGEEAHNAAVTNLHKLKTRSTVESSYNSIVLVNAHDKYNTCQYNYLMYIDENGLGFPINTLIESPVGLDTADVSLNEISTEPRIKISALDISDMSASANMNAQIEQAQLIHDLSNAVTDIINVFNDPGIATSLGLNAGANSDAVQYVNSATSSANSASSRYNKAFGEVLITTISSQMSDTPKTTIQHSETD